MSSDFRERRRPLFQFSLRETLITTVAICAVVALFVKNRPYSPTAFVLGLNEQALIGQCCAELRLPLDIRGTGRSLMHDGTGFLREASFSLGRPSAKETREAVLPAIRSRLVRELRKAGCTLQGGGRANNNFSVRYRSDAGQGVIRNYSLPSSATETHLWILVDEYRSQ